MDGGVVAAVTRVVPGRAVSLESVVKGFGAEGGPTYTGCDLLIMDECTALAANTSGDSPLWQNRNTTPVKAIQTMINLIRSAAKLLACDANLETGPIMVNVVVKIRPADTAMVVSSAYVPPERAVRCTGDPFTLALRMEQDMQAGKRIVAAIASKKVEKKVIKYLVQRSVPRGKLI